MFLFFLAPAPAYPAPASYAPGKFLFSCFNFKLKFSDLIFLFVWQLCKKINFLYNFSTRRIWTTTTSLSSCCPSLSRYLSNVHSLFIQIEVYFQQLNPKWNLLRINCNSKIALMQPWKTICFDELHINFYSFLAPAPAYAAPAPAYAAPVSYAPGKFTFSWYDSIFNSWIYKNKIETFFRQHLEVKHKIRNILKWNTERKIRRLLCFIQKCGRKKYHFDSRTFDFNN